MKFSPIIMIILCLSVSAPAFSETGAERRMRAYRELRTSEINDNANAKALVVKTLLDSIDVELRDEQLRKQNQTFNDNKPHLPERVVVNIDKVLTLYPNLPSESQRELAVQALNLGGWLIFGVEVTPEVRSGRHYRSPVPSALVNPQLGNKLVLSVTESAIKNHWTSNPSLKKALVAIALKLNFGPKLRAQIEQALSALTPSKLPLIEPAVLNLEALMNTEWPPSEFVEKKLPWEKYQLSWMKGRSEQLASTPPEEREGGCPKSVKLYTLSNEQASRVRKDLNILIARYPNLGEADRHDICGRVMKLTAPLLHTIQLQGEATKLFWIVDSSIKIGWLDTGDITGGILYNESQFAHMYDLTSATKLLIQDIAFEAAGKSSTETPGVRLNLGDYYDMMGKRIEAKEQYQYVEQENEILGDDGLNYPESTYRINFRAVEQRLRAYK